MTLREETILINDKNVGSAVISFRDFVCWENNGGKILRIQEILEDSLFTQIEIDFSDVFWFDNLLLCQLCLYMEKAFDEKKRISIFLYERDHLEHVRFVKYLKEAGFLAFFEHIDSSVKLQEESFFYAKEASLWEGNFNSLEIVFPFTVIKQEIATNDLISDVSKSLSNLKLENNTILFRTRFFLEEMLGNVFEHAYDDETPYCCIFLCRKIKRTSHIKATRYYRFKGMDESQVYHSEIKSLTYDANRYRIERFNDIRVDYFQIFVVDIGKGFLRAMGNKQPTQEELTIGQIFTSGKRINKRNKNTQAGGLYMLHNILSISSDAIGIKADYKMYNVESERNDYACVKGINISRDIDGSEKRINGFAVVGYLNLVGEVTKEYRSYFVNPQRELLRDAYQNHLVTYFDGPITVVDFRLDSIKDKPEIVTIPENAKNCIVLVGRETSKNKLVGLFNQGYEDKTDREYDNILIGDFTDVEISKYYMIFQNSKIHAKRVILVSRYYSIAVFGINPQNKLTYNEKMTKEYARNEKKQLSVFDNIYAYVQWLINFESEILWDKIKEYQKNSFQNMFICDPIKWNFDQERNMNAYLDFSQVSFVRECKELFIIQLIRLRALYEQRIYFVSGDRFAEDICELANAELGTTDDYHHISIGSAYVTGTSSLKQTINLKESDENWFYFFKHIDCEENVKVAFLLNWIKEDQVLCEKGKPVYERIDESPFIAAGGVAFFRKKQYENTFSEIIGMNAMEMYRYIQRHHFNDNICVLGHVDLVGPHDIIIFNMVEMFKRDRLESYTQPSYIKTTYDFLLVNFYYALVKKADIIFEKELESNLNNNIVSYEATKAKLLSYFECNKNKLADAEGILMHFTDYATTEIVSFFQKVYSAELNHRIIPISLLSRERGAASLLLSPLLVDSMQKYFDKQKKNEKKCRVTIFSAMVISTKLIDELKHVMFRCGAEEVTVFTLIDRQRLPFGYSVKDRIKTFWRLDIPPLGNKRNCILCGGITNLSGFVTHIGNETIIERVNEICKIWMNQKAFAPKLAAIEPRVIQIPSNVSADISKIYDLGAIEISTDIGLALFAIEDTAISRSFKFLDGCLDAELDDETKIMLICAYLGLFRKVEISEKRRWRLVEMLYGLLKNQIGPTNYTALALVILVAQEGNVAAELNRITEGDVRKQCVYQNLDALISGVFSCWSEGKKTNYNIEYYFNNSSTSLAEKIHAIFYYTYTKCETTHAGVLRRIKEEGVVCQEFDYREAYYKIVYLKNIYDEFPIDLLDPAKKGETLLQDIRVKVLAVEQCLKEYFNKGDEGQALEIKKQIKDFMHCAEKLDNIFIRKCEADDLLKDLEDIKRSTIEKISENDKGLIDALNSVVIEWPEFCCADNEEAWYFWTSDIINEIRYLLLDFRYLKQKFLYCMPKGHACEFENTMITGVVQASFTDKSLDIHFLNRIAEEADTNEIVERKKLKNNRPSILRIKELYKDSGELFSFSFKNKDGIKMIDACLSIPYFYKKRS